MTGKQSRESRGSRKNSTGLAGNSRAAPQGYKAKACFGEKGLSSVAGRNVKEVRPLEMKKTTFLCA